MTKLCQTLFKHLRKKRKYKLKLYQHDFSFMDMIATCRKKVIQAHMPGAGHDYDLKWNSE